MWSEEQLIGGTVTAEEMTALDEDMKVRTAASYSRGTIRHLH